MHWNHRVIKRVWEPKSGNPEDRMTQYGIYETYYDAEGKVHATLEEPEVSAESLDGLKEVLKWLTEAVEKAEADETCILDYGNHIESDWDPFEEYETGEKWPF